MIACSRDARERRRVGVACLSGLGLIGLAACGQSASSPSTAGAGDCTPGAGITQAAETPRYRMVLDVGPREAMYTPAQVQAHHPRNGEVMLRGQMGNMGNMGKMGKMGNMGSSASTRHLEVHICNRSTGKVATNLQPVITLVDNSAANMTNRVPSATMQGTTSGAADLHYGNNVIMPASRRFTVTVAVGDQHATFQVQTPPAA